MLNFNGNLLEKETFKLEFNNRGFTYGDSIFDTSIFINDNIQFLEDHYFRLMASMRMLRMEIPMFLNLSFFKNEILKTIKASSLSIEARVKFTVFRKSGGLYLPSSNSVSFLIEVSELKTIDKQTYTIDIFKDYFVNTDLLSTIKTNNRILNVVASIYASENNLDSCILINQNKQVVETTNANIFLIFGNKIVTPPITDGCIKGIMRLKVIESIQKYKEFNLEESSISPFDLQKADSLFITNSVIGIQAVTNYRKKKYNSFLVDMVKTGFDALYLNA